MNVANILPGDTVEVEMKYTELLIPDNAVYEFVFPTVTGPRYSSKKKSDGFDTNQLIIETNSLLNGLYFVEIVDTKGIKRVIKVIK